MRSILLGTLAVLLSASIALPTRGGAAVARAEASGSAAMSFEKSPSLARRTPLSISSVVCEGIYCEAYAEGGSGTGYSFTWTNMTEMYEVDGYSQAYVSCPFNGQKLVSVTVTDSNGSTAKRQWYMHCGYIEHW